MAENAFSNDPAIVKEFVVEFTEHVQSLELNVLALEKDTGNLSILNEIFRPIHTLKGTSAFLGFGNIAEFSHKLENLLDDLRKGKKTVTPEIIDLMLVATDIIKRLIEDVAHGGNGSGIEVTGAIAQIEMAAGNMPPPEKNVNVPKSPSKCSGDFEVFLSSVAQYIDIVGRCLHEVETGNRALPVMDGYFRALHSIKASATYMSYGGLAALVDVQERLVDAVRKNQFPCSEDTVKLCCEGHRRIGECYEAIRNTGQDSSDPGDIIALFESHMRQKDAAALPEAAAAAETKVPSETKSQANYTEQTIRVSMQKLDLLMNLIGELIINKSRFDLIGKQMEAGGDLLAAAHELNDAALSMARITDGLHAAIMDTRMVTIWTLFNRFPRVVRELGKKKNKEIELAMSGEETEIDKAIIEEINDPLLHLIRNAADHGIEAPEKRALAGKPKQGTIFLRAYHESGSVVIEVEDDGKGIDTAAIKEKALSNGLITPEQAERMSEQELLSLIFLPGFSTAEEVTDISGRGVGMDVVKTNIEKLRGKIHIQTRVGKGTKMILKLPLTMAIIETLMVRVGKELFALPILSVNAVAELKSSDIQSIQENKAVILHGKTISVVYLREVLNIPRTETTDKVYLVVLEVKNEKGVNMEIGFLVDSLQDKQKIVIKPLDDSVVQTYGFSGVTILGDGQIALIIDPLELMEMAIKKL